MHLLIYGNPVDGLTIVGPVEPNTPELDEFIDRDLRNETWWLVEASTIEDTSGPTDGPLDREPPDMSGPNNPSGDGR